FGENIYYIGGNTAKCEDAVDLWYSEIKNLNGKYPGGSWTLKEGHFTQVMWAGSTGLGCAATNGQNCEGRTIVICNYKPQGNWEEVWNSIMEASAPFSLSSSPLFALLAAVAGCIVSWALIWL
ncbi:SCP-like domain-containing protein, putative, partial [Eimeria maxima]